MMNAIRFGFVVCLAMVIAGCITDSATRPPAVSGAETYVIVHGAWGGGWAFREVDALLTAQGYTVYRPTLTGQGERVHLASLDVGLETHIQDVVNMFLFEELENVILVGHSYGGMVVTGVADRIPERISHMIYLDAIVPRDGESVATAMTGGEEESGWVNSAVNGYIIPQWVRPGQSPPKDVPHPVKTFTDRIDLKNPDRMKIPTDYILTVDPGADAEKDSFFPYAERAREFGWPVHHMPADHNPQWSHPQALAELLVKCKDG